MREFCIVFKKICVTSRYSLNLTLKAQFLVSQSVSQTLVKGFFIQGADKEYCFSEKLGFLYHSTVLVQLVWKIFYSVSSYTKIQTTFPKSLLIFTILQMSP